jgi:hypothetical protein
MAELPYDMAGGSGYREWCTDSDVWESALHDRIAGYESFRYDPTGDDPGDFGDFGEYYLHVKSLLDSGEVIVFQSNPDPVRIDFGAVADDESTSEDDDWVGETVITRGLDGPDHTMALVGYNDLLWVDTNDDGEVQSAERGAFRIADSFGTDVPFHEDGFLWLAYQALDDAIFEDRFFTLQVRENYVPSKIARITLHHARRDELKFQFGRAAEASSDGLSDWVFDPYGLGYGTGAAGVSLIDGAACSFDGSSEATEASFAFDLTDLDGSEGGNYWYLRIVNEGSSPLTIRDFTIVGRESEELWVDSELPVTAVEEEVLRFVEVSPR